MLGEIRRRPTRQAGLTPGSATAQRWRVQHGEGEGGLGGLSCSLLAANCCSTTQTDAQPSGNPPPPLSLLQLHSNSDRGDGSARYILAGEGANSIFTIDETTGDIHAAKSLDRETKAQYVLHARAIDWRTNQSLETESEFIVKVQDVNDNAPTFPEEPSSATVPERSDIGEPSTLCLMQCLRLLVSVEMHFTQKTHCMHLGILSVELLSCKHGRTASGETWGTLGE